MTWGYWSWLGTRYQTAIPFLIGTKFDTFATFPRDEQEEITKQAKRFAKAMHASLIFCSTSASINVQKIFKIVLAKAFDLKCVIPEIEGVGEPVLLYVDVWVPRVDRSALSAPRLASVRTVRTHGVGPYLDAMPRIWVGLALGSRPSYHFISATQHTLYISPFVHSCIICRRFDPLLLLHITLCLIDLSLYSSHTLQPASIHISGQYISLTF
jgi:hypothetical protein